MSCFLCYDRISTMNLLPYIPTLICKVASKDIPAGRFLNTSLLFADVSGFTAMSEKLAVIGKEGAEELTSILNNYFTRMISIVSSLGGDIIVFGGDAMLIAFNETSNAMECAIKMQTTMEEFKDISSSAGKQTLRMSIGISSGKVFLAALGTEDAAGYGMFGVPVNRVGAVEAVANAGEICFDRTSLKRLQLENHSKMVAKGIFRLEKPLTQNITKPKNNEISDRFNAAPFVHPGLRKRLEGGFESGEHRKVTIMFINFRDVNPILRESRKNIISTLNDFFCNCLNIITSYDGFLCKIDVDKVGCKMMIIFGAPRSHENDIERAFHTALDINRLDSPFKFRTGINTGFVYAGFVGAPERKEYTVMGDAVNIAARLMASAPEGEIYVRDKPESFNLTALEPIKVKGKSEPLELFRLNGVELSKQKQENSKKETPFVGRKKELTILLDSYQSILNRKGKLVFLKGEAGIGKSRLLRECIATFQSKKATIMTGECPSHTSMSKYHCWKSIFNLSHKSPDELKQYIISYDPSLVEWLPLLGEFFGIPIEETAETIALNAPSRKRILFDAINQIILKMSAENPVIIAIDSVQWIDKLSMELIEHIAKNIDNSRVLLILSGRYSDISEKNTVEIQPFDRAELSEITASLLDNQNISKEVLELLFSKSKGNPLFLLEVLKSLIEEKWIYFDEHFNEYALNLEYSSSNTPDSLRGIIMAGVDRLDEKARQLLQLASVAGSSFETNLLKGISGEISHSALDELIKKEFLTQYNADTMGFSQPVIQEAVYESISFTEKRKYHFLIGQFIENNTDNIEKCYYTLASHFYNSSNQTKALHYLESAGEKARKEADNYLALDCYKKILSLSQATTQQKALSCLYLGNIYSIFGEFEKSMENYDKGCKLNLSDLLPQFHFRIGELLRKKGKLDEAEEYFLKVTKGISYADALASLGLLQAMQGNLDKALSHLKSAEKHFIKNNNKSGLAYCLINIGEIARLQGNADKAIEQMEQALNIFVEAEDISGESNVLLNLGIIHNDLCNYKEAIKCKSRALKLSEKIRDHHKTCTILINLGLAYIDTGLYSDAKSCLSRSLMISGKMNDLNSQALALLNLSRIEFEEGEIGQSLKSLDKAMNYAKQTGNLLYQVFVNIRSAEILLGIGALDKVSLHLEEMEKIISKYNIKQCEVYLHLYSGNIEALRENTKKAETALHKALEVSTSLGQKSESIRALLLLSRMERRRGDLSTASSLLDRAITTALEIKSEPLLLECALEQALCGRDEPYLRPLSRTFNVHILAEYNYGMALNCLKNKKKTKANEYAQKSLKTTMSIAASIEDPELQNAYLNDCRREELRKLMSVIRNQL